MKKKVGILVGVILILISIILFSYIRAGNPELDLSKIIQRSNIVKNIDTTLKVETSEGRDKHSSSTRTILIEEKGIYQGYQAKYESTTLLEEIYIYDNYIYDGYSIKSFELSKFDYNNMPLSLKFDEINKQSVRRNRLNNKVSFKINKNKIDYSDFFNYGYGVSLKIDVSIIIIVDSETELLDSMSIKIKYKHSGTTYKTNVEMQINAYGDAAILNIAQSIKDNILEYKENQNS